MKKNLIYFLGITATIAAFASCNINSKEGDDSMWGGWRLYENAAFQQAVSIEPLNVAVRLHILLSETQKQGLEDFEETTVKFGSVDNYSLRTMMFGKMDIWEGATIESLDDGTAYKIVYPQNYLNTIDTWKIGTIVVYTGGKLLNEPGANWSVTAGPTDSEKLSIRYNSSGENIIVGLSTLRYYIDNIDDSSIRLHATGVRSTLSSVTSDWEMDFVMEKSNIGNFYGYENISKAEFKVTGAASGTTMVNASHFYFYEYSGSTPAIYKATCAGGANPYPIMSGQIDVRVVAGGDSPLDPESYPSPNVSLKWEDMQDCSWRTTMVYNNKSIVL